MLKTLSGYRTYIQAGLGVAIIVAMILGYVSADVGVTILGLLGFGSIAALRSAVSNSENAITDKLFAKLQATPPATLQ